MDPTPPGSLSRPVAVRVIASTFGGQRTSPSRWEHSTTGFLTASERMVSAPHRS